ncbi:hypothetical protein PO433_26660, partial [Escherichia coli]
MDNGAHFDGDQSGTVKGVTPPAVQHLTAEVTADSGEYQVAGQANTGLTQAVFRGMRKQGCIRYQ